MTRRGLLVLTFAMLLGSAGIPAIHIPLETRRVPVDRLVQNLERQAKANPADVQTLVNLARVHAMAYALKVDEFPTSLSADKADVPFFPPGPRTPSAVRPAASPEQAARAAQHLKDATRHYVAALALAPDNLTARIGHGWVLQQAGENAGAIVEYRKVVELAWPKEHMIKGLMPDQRFFTQEAIGYLLELLDPVRDADEIRDLLTKKKEMDSRPRAITPIAIPLADDVSPVDIHNPIARVRFDADGSRLDREWTWITPRAGWLVYDADGRGEITSALQLFGSVTFWLFWSNGYDAMRALDDDADGQLAGAELKHLAIWHDRNANGFSENGEVRPLSSHGIVSLACTYTTGDGVRLAATSAEGVRFTDGRTRSSYDVILRHSPSTLTRRSPDP